MCYEKYYEEQRIRVKKLFSKKHSCFVSSIELANWYIEQLKDSKCKCYYCNTSIHDINTLIDAGLLKERKTGYGFRGRILEIDKNDETYIRENCVLSCYYCNNDKSYITSKDDYKNFFGNNRHEYFKLLISKL